MGMDWMEKRPCVYSATLVKFIHSFIHFGSLSISVHLSTSDSLSV